jgi:uncharacterized protein
MRVLIAGGSGFIGRNFARALLQQGHQPVILSRHADALRRKPEMWPYRVVPGDPTKPGRWQEEIDGCDAVVNLAGHNVFAKRWNTQIKRAIRDSRVYSAENLVAAIKQARVQPKVFVQGSAIGFYGPHGDEEFTESKPSGSDFLAVICRECEEVSAPLDATGVRRAIVRTGIVLARDEGAVRIMLPAFMLAPGAPIGSGGSLIARGNQWMSWIHIEDLVGIFQLALDNEQAKGPINGTAPYPIRNSEFAKTLSSSLRKRHTPWRFYVPFGPPDALLKLALGEVAEIITTGQRVLPAKALELGYTFKFPHLAEALRAIFTAAPKKHEPIEHHHSPSKAAAHH